MDRGNENPTQHLPCWLRKPRKKPSQVGRHRDSNQGPPECESRALPRSHLARFFSLVSAFSQKNKTYSIKWASVCVCVCVCKILVPPNNFQISYPIDTKFWLHIVSYRNSPTPLIPFLNFENCARDNFCNSFFSI